MLGESLRRRRKVSSRPPQGPPLRWSRWIPGGLAAVLLSFGTGYATAVFVLFPVPEAAAGGEAAVVVPRLVGRDRAAAEQELQSRGLVLGEVVELPHPSEREGTVIAQAPLAIQQLRPGAAVRIAVSAGRARALVPDIVGLPAEDGVALARRLGFGVERREENAPGPAGVILRVVPAPGRERELPAEITLVVSVPMPVVAAPDTVLLGRPAGDTAAHSSPLPQR